MEKKISNFSFISVPSTLHKVEMFYLPEILALTDYKHSSSFTGGTFFGKTARSLNDDQAYSRCVLYVLNKKLFHSCIYDLLGGEFQY